MKSKLLYLGLWSLCTMCASCKRTEKTRLSDYVNPNIGTAHSRWFFYTPAAVPFGMAKVGPSTNAHYGNEHGWEAVGYDFRHESIEGFANFHEFQVGGVVLAPIVGTLKTRPGTLEDPDSGYRSRFEKNDEYATAGFYSVRLKDYDVSVDLTATKRVAYHRYVFPETSEAHVLFDIGNQQGESGAVKSAHVTLTDGRVEGYVITMPEYVKKYQAGANVAMYFSAVLDKEPVAWGAFNGDSIRPRENQADGVGAGLYLTFDTKKDEAVTFKVGLSYTSIANARLNLESEAEGLDFNGAKKQAIDCWNDYLGRITVEGKNEDEKRKFYTGLFHALLGRGLASDVNGAYPMNDGGIGQIALGDDRKPIHNHYNTDAIWGAFWNLTQLWAMVYPEYYADWIQSQLLVYKDAGWLGDGIANSKYVSGVGTNFTGLAIAAAYSAGIRNFDIDLAYEAARKNELSWEGRLEGAGKMDVRQFVERGYAPYVEVLNFETTDRGSGFGASHTLEYAFSAYAVAQFAEALGKDRDHRQLMELSRAWSRLYDAESKFIRPRDEDGNFITDFDPAQPWRGFQEGNAWQYTFYVPHDPAGLIEMLGEDVFNARLDSIFTVSREHIFGGGKTIDAFAGLSGLYNHGNQPNLHISWLFNFSGKPWLTQKWTRAIGKEFYGVGPIHGYGFGQDEDQGQLGAWYVISSLGLFDVKGLTDLKPTMQFGSPIFDRATIKLGSGNTLVIETVGNGDDDVYIQSLEVNGSRYEKNWMYWQDLIEGGKLVFEMGEQPNTDWGTGSRPPSVE
ncbi:GH92 family glycosyl hydrolase [Parapedobacter deserti]|uniref:GH92 family glycosyl hydrolase n=1 Tax=Parapedobacter deserti TaxID=1912957 RepID=A0ABV7JM44_9SPHI